MRAIASVSPDTHLDHEALSRISEAVQEWAEHSDKPLILTDGISVELFDDDWNLVARSPVWVAPTVTTELMEARVSPDWTVIGLLVLSIAMSAAAVLLWAYAR
jgi:hypothetical protein